MLQVLHLDVSKVDRELHMLQCDPIAAAAGGDARGWARGTNAMWGRVGPQMSRGSSGTQGGYKRERPDIPAPPFWPLALPLLYMCIIYLNI